MLLQFTVENYLSFRSETTFSMVGVGSDRQHPEHLTEDPFRKGNPWLPIAAIYGANAAGKSNLVEAIRFAQDLVIDGTRSDDPILVEPFKLADCHRKPSRFEFIFTYQGSRYSYGFSLNKEQILEEFLYVIPENKKNEVMYFERTTSSDKETIVDLGRKLKGQKDSNKQFLEFIAKGTRPNQLFLTEAVERNVKDLSPVFDWFRRSLTIVPADADYRGLELGILGDETFTKFLTDFLRYSAVGIDSIRAEEVDLDFEQHFPNMPTNIRDQLRRGISDAKESAVAMVENSLGKRYLLMKKAEDEIRLIRLTAQHRHENGSLVDFTIDEESEGTQRLINLIPALFLLNENPEKTIILDELDRRLHPLLSRTLVQASLNCRGHESQLIFTTHDSNLLDLDLLRRDEIWFVEKDQKGASTLYSLAEFKIRPDLKISKGYLNGRFGAIPFFGDPERLGWLNCDPTEVS